MTVGLKPLALRYSFVTQPRKSKFGMYVDIYNIGLLTVNIEFFDEAEKRGERRAFSESFSPFRAESNKFYIYRQQTNIVFILQSTMS